MIPLNKAPRIPDSQLLIKGRHEVLSALKHGIRVQAIYFLEGARGAIFEEIKTAARQRNIPVQILKSDTFKGKVGGDSQGVAGIAAEYAYSTEDAILTKFESGASGVILALNNLEDPRNLGAIIRSASAGGVKGILIPKNRSAGVTEWAIRTSQGAAFEISIARVTNMTESLKRMKEKGFWVYGMSEKAKTRYDKIKFAEKCVLVAGGEDAGLGNLVEKTCDEVLFIPMTGEVGSLNVSVSVSIVLFEVLRQWNFHDTGE